MDEKKCINTYRTFELDDNEIAERKKILMHELDRKDILTADLEDHKKRYQTLIKTSDLTIEKLRDSIKAKSEMIRVDIYYNDPIRGEKRIVREDNDYEFIEDMDEQELKMYAQFNIFTKES